MKRAAKGYCRKGILFLVRRQPECFATKEDCAYAVELEDAHPAHCQDSTQDLYPMQEEEHQDEYIHQSRESDQKGSQTFCKKSGGYVRVCKHIR